MSPASMISTVLKVPYPNFLQERYLKRWFPGPGLRYPMIVLSRKPLNEREEASDG
jgi:hypothetical protein